MTRLEILKELFARSLAAVHAKNPDAYGWPTSELPMVTARMLAAIDRYKGVRGINIDSPSFRLAAKELGIKNTYKAWAAWLAAEYAR